MPVPRKFACAVYRLFSQGPGLLLSAGWDKSLGSSGLLLCAEVLPSRCFPGALGDFFPMSEILDHLLNVFRVVRLVQVSLFWSFLQINSFGPKLFRFLSFVCFKLMFSFYFYP